MDGWMYIHVCMIRIHTCIKLEGFHIGSGPESLSGGDLIVSVNVCGLSRRREVDGCTVYLVNSGDPLSTMESSHNRSLAPNPTHRDTHAESRVEPSKQVTSEESKTDEHSHARRRQERDVQEVWPGVAGMGVASRLQSFVSSYLIVVQVHTYPTQWMQVCPCTYRYHIITEG